MSEAISLLPRSFFLLYLIPKWIGWCCVASDVSCACIQKEKPLEVIQPPLARYERLFSVLFTFTKQVSST